MQVPFRSKTGLEKSYERELHGESGFQEVEVDAGGRAVRTLSRTPPVSGNNLVLSIDLKLQQIAEKAFGERRGALVAIEPGSGDVLAYVSRPGFDPNLFVDGIDPQNWEALNNSPDHPMINRPINGVYPPEHGRIIFREKDVTTAKTYEHARMGMARTHQIVKPLNDLSVRENVMGGACFGRMGHNLGEAARLAGETGSARRPVSPVSRVAGYANTDRPPNLGGYGGYGGTPPFNPASGGPTSR